MEERVDLGGKREKLDLNKRMKDHKRKMRMTRKVKEKPKKPQWERRKVSNYVVYSSSCP